MTNLSEENSDYLDYGAPKYPPKALFEPFVGFDLRAHSRRFRLLSSVAISNSGIAIIDYVCAAFSEVCGASPSAHECQKQANCSNGVCEHFGLLSCIFVSASTPNAMQTGFRFLQAAA